MDAAAHPLVNTSVGFYDIHMRRRKGLMPDTTRLSYTQLKNKQILFLKIFEKGILWKFLINYSQLQNFLHKLHNSTNLSRPPLTTSVDPAIVDKSARNPDTRLHGDKYPGILYKGVES